MASGPDADSYVSPGVLPHTPLLWVCVPAVFGLAAGLLWPEASIGLLAWTGFCALALALGLSYWKNAPRALWPLCFTVGVFCVAWGYYAWRNPPLPAPWRDYPPREMTVELEIERVFSSSAAARYPSTSGLGRLRVVPALAKELRGLSVYFHAFAQNKELLPGAHITLRAVVEPVDGRFSDFDRYLADNGVRLKVSRGVLTSIVQPPADLRAALDRLNARAEATLREGFSQSASGVFVAMLLGRSSALSKEQKEDFSLTGTLHLFAISGLHVALIAGILTFILRAVRVPGRWRPFLVLPVLLVYVGMTGFAASAMRAFTMIVFLWGARWLGRSSGSLSALAASALCLLAYDPAYIGNAGFQLSYAVVAAIILYGVPLTQALERRFPAYPDLPVALRSLPQRLWTHLRAAFFATGAISLAAFMLSTPLCFEAFGTFALGGILLNMVLVPFASVVLFAGVVSLFLGAVSAPVWALYPSNALGVGGTQAMAVLTSWAQETFPLLYQRVSPPWPGFGAVATLGLLALLLWWRRGAEQRGLSYYLLPLGAWGYFMALGSL